MKKQFLLMMMALLPMIASADGSGVCGYRLYDVPDNPYAMSDNVRWNYVESTHTLTISGTGEMMNFGPWDDVDPTSFTTTPWDNFKEDIQNLVVQSGVTTVDGFMNCKNLTSVTLSNTVVNIKPFAFWNCAFSSINIPNSVKSIGFGSFYGCNNLTSITIPSSVGDIGYYAFRGCSSLESIQVEPGNTVYDSRNNCNAIIWDWTEDIGIKHVNLLAGCKNTVIPDAVDRIDYFTFAGCTGLTTLKIPQNVKEVCMHAFDGCSNLSSVYCYASVVPETWGGGYFQRWGESLGSVQNATLYVPSILVDEYKSTQTQPRTWGADFKAIMPIESSGDPKCATPTIKVENGILRFECATEGVDFHYSVQSVENGTDYYSGIYNKANDTGTNGVVLPYATISVYASKSGYSLSDTATLTVKLSNSGKLGDLNGDGVVNVADHVELSKIIFAQ